jgi:endonuclease/exonuclease/phosphatase family metal-dependent hydrolase
MGDRQTPWPLTAATYNIHGAVGCDGRFAPDRIIDVLHELQADIIALQEVPLGGTRYPDVLSVVADATGYEHAEGAALITRERRYGNAVLSRFPILSVRRCRLRRRTPARGCDPSRFAPC